MPTLKPRLSITLDASDLAVLDRYAAASKRPRASLIAELIQATIPELDRAACLIEQANAAPAGVVRGLVEDLSNATADAMGFLKPFSDDYQAVMNKLQTDLWQQEKDELESGSAAVVTGLPGAAAAEPRRRHDCPLDPHLLTGGSKL